MVTVHRVAVGLEGAAKRRGDYLIELTKMLQNEQQRNARGYLANHAPDLVDRAYTEAADEAGHVFLTVGFLCRTGVLEETLVLENWSVTIERGWERAEPWIAHRRANENNNRLFREFEELAGRAAAYNAAHP